MSSFQMAFGNVIAIGTGSVEPAGLSLKSTALSRTSLTFLHEGGLRGAFALLVQISDVRTNPLRCCRRNLTLVVDIAPATHAQHAVLIHHLLVIESSVSLIGRLLARSWICEY